MNDPVPTGEYVPSSDSDSGAAAGQRIGPYKLLQPLGHGGMGEVWLAEQSDPIRRRVALKLIKAGMDTQQVLSRFQAERQALALMDHPNIAKVLDAGRTDAGRPYFVMELVQGIPITQFCDKEKLTIRERLDLFIAICQAVQHAHQKGIIHRDLKPTNILVAIYDGKPVPKVIDFGVAKAIASKLTEHTLITELGQPIGTPEYMAPEQAEHDNLDIDTRADIYSLGVVLYELLAGSPPFSRKQLKNAAVGEMLRMIREVEPQKPSTKLSTTDELPSLAATRKLEPKRLMSTVRGELDWIVMKCLEKERARRYETANGLAMDIQQYLTDQPVLAGPPSATYRVRKFVRRNKGGVLAASILLLSLVAGIAGTTWGMQRAVAERNEKEVARAQIAAEQKQTAKERDRAEEEKQIAQAVRDFLQKKLLGMADTKAQADALLAFGIPSSEAAFDPKISVLLDRAAAELAPEKIESQFPNTPLVQAEILQTIGNTYRRIGELKRAISHLERARDIYAANQGRDHPNTLTALNDLARAYDSAGQLSEAIPIYERVRDATQANLGTEHEDTLTSLAQLADAYRSAGRVTDAIRLLEQVRDIQMTKLGAAHPSTIATLDSLAMAYQAAGKLSEAIRLLEQISSEADKTLGPAHPDSLLIRHNLAEAYRKTRKWDEAIRIFEQVRDLQDRKLGPDHPNSLVTRNNLAEAYRNVGRTLEAIQLFEYVRDHLEKKVGEDHPNTLRTLSGLASAYADGHRLPEAIQLFEQVLDSQDRKLGPVHPSTLRTMGNLAVAYWNADRRSDAVHLLQQLQSANEKAFGAGHKETLTALYNLAAAYNGTGQYAAGISILEQLAANTDQDFQRDHADRVARLMINCYEQLKNIDKAETWRRKCLAVVKQKAGPESAAYAGELVGLGENLLRQNKIPDAEIVLRESFAIREKKEPGAWTTFNTQSLLGAALAAQQKYDESEKLLLAGYAGIKQRADKIPPKDKGQRLQEAIDRLVQLYDAWGKPDDAAKWRKELDELRKATPKPKPAEQKP